MFVRNVFNRVANVSHDYMIILINLSDSKKRYTGMCEKISYAAGLTSPILQLSPYHEIKLAG